MDTSPFSLTVMRSISCRSSPLVMSSRAVSYTHLRHDPDRLAAAVLDVYRRRAVRIFRGEQRYIIEE